MYDPARSLFPLHTAEHLCDANTASTSRSLSLSLPSPFREGEVFTNCDQYGKMYKSFVHQYYRITGSANQIRSDGICLRSRGRGNQLSLYSDDIVSSVFIRHIFGVACDTGAKLHLNPILFTHSIGEICVASER